MIKALQALRGVRLVTAAVLAEIGGFARFRRPRQLMAYLGLAPSERSSGKSRRPPARRLLPARQDLG